MNFQLMLGDCMDRMREIPTGSVDMVLCDLPYGTTQNKWDSVIPLAPLWAEYKRLCKANAAIVLTAAQPFSSALVMSNIEWFRYEWVWKKSRASNQTMAKAQPLRTHENVLIFGGVPAHNTAKIRLAYYPQDLVRVSKMTKQGLKISENLGDGRTRAAEYFQEFANYPKSVLEIPSEGATVHPTQKPVALMEYLINTYTNPGETVLDNTMGSGTTGVACGNTGRKFIGIERDPGYFEIARRRIAGAYLPPLPGPPNK